MKSKTVEKNSELLKRIIFIMSQINFIIGRECEKQLLDFIANECQCRILKTESETTDFEVAKDGKITADKYLLSPLPKDFKFRIEKRQSNYSSDEVFVIFPFDENMDFLPIIEYERDCFSEKAKTPCRIHLRSTVSPRYKKEMKLLFQKIKKYIQDNSINKIPKIGIPFYEMN